MHVVDFTAKISQVYVCMHRNIANVDLKYPMIRGVWYYSACRSKLCTVQTIFWVKSLYTLC